MLKPTIKEIKKVEGAIIRIICANNKTEEIRGLFNALAINLSDKDNKEIEIAEHEDLSEIVNGLIKKAGNFSKIFLISGSLNLKIFNYKQVIYLEIQNEGHLQQIRDTPRNILKNRGSFFLPETLEDTKKSNSKNYCCVIS